jgi:hypothetical protein
MGESVQALKSDGAAGAAALKYVDCHDLKKMPLMSVLYYVLQGASGKTESRAA